MAIDNKIAENVIFYLTTFSFSDWQGTFSFSSKHQDLISLIIKGL